MKPDRSLMRILEDLSISLSENGEMRDIEFRNDDKSGAISPEGDITVNPDPTAALDLDDYDLSEEQEFGLIINTESHEIEHDQVSDLRAKEKLANDYEKFPRVAGFIWNVVEDVYIDKRRTDRDRGLRPLLALSSELIHRANDPITEYSPPKKHVNAVLHIGKAGGTPIGFHNVDDDEFREYCAKVRDLIDDVENAHTQKERREITDDIIDLIDEYAGIREMPDLEMPDGIPMGLSEDEMEDGDPLPDPNMEFTDPDDIDQDEDTDEDQENSNGMEMNMPMSNGDDNKMDDQDENQSQSQESDPKCPQCDSESISPQNKIVEGMVAARCNAPFSTDSNWINNIEFIKNNEVCGFRIKHTGDYPKDIINNSGYIVDEISSQTIEVLEPKSNYDSREEIEQNLCNNCGHKWLPNLSV